LYNDLIIGTYSVLFGHVKLDVESLRHSAFVRNEEIVLAQTLQNNRIADKNVVSSDLVMIWVYCLQGI